MLLLSFSENLGRDEEALASSARRHETGRHGGSCNILWLLRCISTRLLSAPSVETKKPRLEILIAISKLEHPPGALMTEVQEDHASFVTLRELGA